MPAILNHHLLGRSVLAKLDGASYNTRDERDAFLLGNQGPDPLFFGTFSLKMVNIKKLGSRMHSQDIEQLLEAWRNMLADFSPNQQKILEAYICGYLCHFALDRTAHPYIYAYQHAITAAGVPGLGPDANAFVHAQIEADLDVYMLYKLTGRTIGEYYIPKQVLYSSKEALELIDKLYNVAATNIYNIKVPGNVFSLSVRDMRRAIKLTFSPGGTRRGLIGRVERVVRPHSLMQAISHRTDAYLDCWYANEEHATWEHPATAELSNAAYAELFELALNTAILDINKFKAGEPAAKISDGLDFLGNPVGAEQ